MSILVHRTRGLSYSIPVNLSIVNTVVTVSMTYVIVLSTVLAGKSASVAAIVTAVPSEASSFISETKLQAHGN